MQPIYSPLPKFMQREQRRRRIAWGILVGLIVLVSVVAYFAAVSTVFGPMPIN